MLALLTLCITLLLLLPVAAGIALRRRRAVPWSLFFVGVTTFAMSQVAHLPLLYLARRAGWIPSTLAAGGASPGVALLLGAVAGLCEESMRAVGYWLRPGARRVKDGVMLGLGHGGIEAMIVGGVFTAASVGAYLGVRHGAPPEGLSPEQAALLQQGVERILGSPGGVLLVLVERGLALVLHVALSLLVLCAFTRRSAAYLGLAIAYHAGVDALAAFASGRISSLWLIEALVAVLVAPGAAWAFAIFRKTAAAVGAAPALPLAAELAVFAAVLRKELWQLARTYRLLISAVVFALLGFLGPLSARFAPELIRRLAGPKLAISVAEPTVLDALGQYIKQINQVGLLVTVLLAMGSVASEKERGTAIMALCKPVPRWAFIAGKWAAQALVALGSLLLAAACTLSYAIILFGAVPAGDFAWITLLLFAFLLCFLTASIFASTLAKTASTAAGLSLLAALALLVMGSVPGLASLSPTALLAWANGIAHAEGAPAAAPNLGALAMSATLVLLLLLGAVAAFEQQEL